ncbi:hypothetical protein ACROYT_G007504 [Oculina patagonica]
MSVTNVESETNVTDEPNESESDRRRNRDTGGERFLARNSVRKSEFSKRQTRVKIWIRTAKWNLDGDAGRDNNTLPKSLETTKHSAALLDKSTALDSLWCSTSVACSILTLTAIAVERFCSITFPFKRIITFKLAKAMVVGIWLFSFLMTIPFFFHIKVEDYYGDGVFYCVEDWSPLDTTAAAQVFQIVFLYSCTHAH